MIPPFINMNYACECGSQTSIQNAPMGIFAFQCTCGRGASFDMRKIWTENEIKQNKEKKNIPQEV
mgnify:CR=1 FL=1